MTIPVVGTLTVFGLLLDLAGAVILLGPEFKPVGKYVRKLDPVYRAENYAFQYLIDQASNPEEGEFAYDVDASQWQLQPLRWFLNRRMEGRISRSDSISLDGGWFKLNGKRTKLPKERRVRTPDISIDVETLSASNVSYLMEEARERRIYLYGVGLLAIGFGLQLVDQAISLI